MLRDLLGNAQAVTFFYEAEAECFWRLYKDSLNPSRIHIIPNGFDGEVEPFVLPAGDDFTILYTGTLSDYRYETFLDALRILKKRDPAQARRVQVQFVGEGIEDVARLAIELNIADIVSTSAPMPSAEIYQRQRHAHALLMLERRPTRGYELLAGAKLFGYLKVGRPILGVVPEGEAARVLRDVGVSTIADPDSPEKICAVVETMLNLWSAGKLSSLVPDRSACAHYSGKAQTSALVRALEGRPPIKEFVPGAVDIVPSLRAEFAAAGWA
jgi:glycosyltransferase involved in cell wall biosynthesis